MNQKHYDTRAEMESYDEDQKLLTLEQRYWDNEITASQFSYLIENHFYSSDLFAYDELKDIAESFKEEITEFEKTIINN